MNANNRILRLFVMTLVVCTVLSGRAALEVWVDKSVGSDTAGRGTSESPYATIQKGVGEVAEGGTVWVRPGDYSTGETVDADGSLNRVYITKNLTLAATGDRRETIIRGASASDASASNLGCGDTAVRCVRVAGGTKVVVRGFTLTGGRTRRDSNWGGVSQNYGGGVHGSGSDGSIQVQDCIISDCAARSGGAAFRVHLVRCFVTGCQSKNVGSVGREMRAYNSVFFRNGASGYALFAWSYGVVNCTAAENLTPVFSSAYEISSNCLLMKNAGGVGDFAAVRNSATDDPLVKTNDAALENNCSFCDYAKSVFAPLKEDFRLVSGCSCVGTGVLTDLPEAYRDLDYNCKPRLTSGTLSIGATEERGTAVALVLADGSFAGSAVSGAITKTLDLESHANTEVYPSPVKMKLPFGGDVQGNLWVTNTAGDKTYISYDETVWLPSYSLTVNDAVVTNFLEKTDVGKRYVLWVDRERGNDVTGSYADQTNHPYQSIQAAVNLASGNWPCAVIYVKKGRYDNGGAIGTGTVSNRVYFGHASWLKEGRYRVVAIDGPEQTAIVGVADGDDSGCGSKAVRCIETANGYKVFTGFTLENGHSGTNDDAASLSVNNETRRGGAAYRIYGPGYSCALTDCVITNCTGERGVTYSVDLVRCRVIGGGCYNAPVFVDSKLSSSLVWGCGPTTGGSSRLLGTSSVAYNCSFGPTTQSMGLSNDSSAYNSVFDIGVTVFANGSLPGALKYSLYARSGVTLSGDAYEGSIKDSAHFRNSATGDLRMLSLSQGHGLADFSVMNHGCQVDVDGNPFVGSSTGQFIAGGKVGAPLEVIVSSSYADGVSPSGFVAVSDAGDLALQAVKAEKRPLLGFKVNKTMIQTHEPNYTFKVSDWPGVTAFEITAVYGTEFWADIENGDEANSGFYPDVPKKYISSAMALTEDGDTVVALPGTYDDRENPTLHAAGLSIASRVVVPTNRTLRSRDGANSTAIVGRKATSPNKYGCGTDAVRCVFVAPGGMLSGFTLTGGCTAVAATSSTDGDDYCGGGALGWGVDSLVENCVITGCGAYRGGGVRGVTCRYSKIVNNGSSWFGSSAFNANLCRCYLDGATGGAGNSLGYHVYAGNLDSCTIGARNFAGDGKTLATLLVESATGYLRNSIVAGGIVSVPNIENCAFAEGLSVTGLQTGCFTGEVALDADGVPVIGHNVGIDATDDSVLSDEAKTQDLIGCARVWNGAYDLGAYEVDWREHYAHALCPKNLTVQDAPEQAVEQADGRILVKEGVLSCVWTNAKLGRDVEYRLDYEVCGTGTLVVKVNGQTVETVVAAAGKRSYVFGNASAANAMAFEYLPGANDDRGALLGGFGRKSLVGMAVIVR